LGIMGGSATTPFKHELAKQADELEEPARILEAANAFRYHEGRLIATNTDIQGVRDPLERAGLDISNEHVLILGAGGAAAAAALALKDAKSLTITNRTAAKAEALAKRMAPHLKASIAAWDERHAAAKEATLIIQCTLLGMNGTTGEGQDPLPDHEFRGDQSLYELVYNPLETPIMQRAKKADARVLDGLEMLLAQGVAAYRFWLDKEPPREAMREAILEAAKIPLPQSVEESMRTIPPQQTQEQEGEEQE
jgi:shikimate dehydrogenase